jgi:hypothetical protein
MVGAGSCPPIRKQHHEQALPYPCRIGASDTGGTMAGSFQSPKSAIIVACLISLAGCAAMNPGPGKRELMVVGNDEKVGISDAGAFVFSAPGNDTVSRADADGRS